MADERLEEAVGRMLRERGLTLAVAESCTGGLISHRITNVPGSSDYFLGGVVTYSNQAKVDLLRVSREILAKHGAVSAATARAMAAGVRHLFQADVGVAVTGIAGPGGGTPAKPVGTVFIGVARGEGVEVRHHQFQGTREQIKGLTADAALEWLSRELAT